MLKRLVLVAGSLVGLSYLRKKVRQQQAEQDLWAQATDDVTPAATPAAPPTVPPTPAPAPAADDVAPTS